MKVLFLLLTLAYSNSFAPLHDVPIAVFHIAEFDDSIQINIIFDIEDFHESLGVKANEVTLEYMQNYLDENTSFQFNTQVADLKISEVKMVRDHIKVKGSFGKLAQKVETIKIENYCLTNIPHHSNVIQVDLNNKFRDFRMHIKRTEINLRY